jgi:hypothetical protein
VLRMVAGTAAPMSSSWQSHQNNPIPDT